jgi:hypothetical protein
MQRKIKHTFFKSKESTDQISDPIEFILCHSRAWDLDPAKLKVSEHYYQILRNELALD